VKAESVLRDRNLNNYTGNTKHAKTYLHEEVVVKVLALSVLLVLILESASGG
jgi:hypothetical protein